MKVMKFAVKGLALVGFVVVLASCQNSSFSDTFKNTQWFPSAKRNPNAPVNCDELKRQRLYNMTNMNTETNDTTQYQRDQLDDLIAKNCK